MRDCSYNQFYLEHFSIHFYHFTVLCSNAEQLTVSFPETVLEIAGVNLCIGIAYQFPEKVTCRKLATLCKKCQIYFSITLLYIVYKNTKHKSYCSVASLRNQAFLIMVD